MIESDWVSSFRYETKGADSSNKVRHKSVKKFDSEGETETINFDSNKGLRTFNKLFPLLKYPLKLSQIVIFLNRYDHNIFRRFLPTFYEKLFVQNSSSPVDSSHSELK